MANSACGVTLVKRVPYRGDTTEEFSNTYWFTGATPADDTAWKALADALIASEKTLLRTSESVIRAYGYDSPNDVNGEVAAWSYDYLGNGAAVAGTFVETGLMIGPGDTASWIRWRTPRRTSPGNKVIYLRKYFHPAILVAGGGDILAATWRTAALAHGIKMKDATLPAARKICSMHHDEDATNMTDSAVTVATYATTRTLKRRGKRNPTT